MLLSHLVTSRCPCRCETCLWRGLTRPEDDLTAEEIAAVYRDAGRCGMRLNSIWGGEPLVRPDLPQILRASRNAGLLTILITSGWGLRERFEAVAFRVDVFIFSLDQPGLEHDAMRGQPGLFDAACAAIRRIRCEIPDKRVYINSVVSRLNVDAVPALARLARKLGAWIYYSPMETGMLGQPGSMAAKQDLALDEAALSSLSRDLIVLKSRGLPVANSYTYLRTFLTGRPRYHCHARKLCVELRPNGDLMDCLDRFHPVANVREVSLSELLARREVRRSRLRNVSCHVCNNANVIDTSYVWELKPESIYSLVRRHLPPGRSRHHTLRRSLPALRGRRD